MRNAFPERPRVRLWMKLAALVAAVVALMHGVRLALGQSISSRAMAAQHAALGHSIARLVAREVTDAFLVGDAVKLHEIVTTTATADESGVVYCFVVRDGRVIASSFLGLTPADLVAARQPGKRDPIVLVGDRARTMDVVEPILGNGELRVGIAMDVLDAMQRELLHKFTVLAIVLTAVGVAAAFVIGRRVARPVEEMLTTAERFDPAEDGDVPCVRVSGSDEIAVLAARWNQMMVRLRNAHVTAEVARQKTFETQRLAAMGSLTAGVAHEVNNPLAGLKNCVRRFERSDLPEPKRREYLAHMREALDRIGDVVQRLLDFGRPHPVRLETVELDELARDGVRLAFPLLHERRIACDVEDPERAAGPVHADRHAIGHALLNLLLNAAYVTPDGGILRVRLRRREGYRGIAVVDEGPGIPEAIRERVLDPFFSTKPEGQGTGLGLSVSRSIVDAHGGELALEFPARGTVVTVWLRDPSAVPQRVA